MAAHCVATLHIPVSMVGVGITAPGSQNWVGSAEGLAKSCEILGRKVTDFVNE